MDIDSTKLTVFFEAPFWIGVFEPKAIATANPKRNSCHRNRYKVTAGVANAARRKQAGAKST